MLVAIEAMMNKKDIDPKSLERKLDPLVRKRTASLKMKALDSNCEGHEDAKNLLLLLMLCGTRPKMNWVIP